MKIFFKKNWDKIILFLVVILAAAIRLYHFHDWLYFAMDQARDAMLVSRAYDNGISSLPLLGPRAAGTFLRLGPIFYYFQFISAKLFHSTDPAVLAFPDLFFSILSIPLFFVFLRLYFKKLPSLLATTLYAFSFLAVQYSRFAWNPNSAPFWILVCFYSLLRFDRSDDKKKYWWLAAFAVGWAVASQLHFLVFLSLPVIIAFFLISSGAWRKIGWRGVLIVFLIIGIFYFPVFLSEINTKGDNIKQFVFATNDKLKADSTLKEDIFQNFINQGNYFSLVLTSFWSRTGKTSMLLGLVFVTASAIKIFFLLWDEKDEKRKNFLKLAFCWFAVMFLALTPFAFKIRPRFFFPSFFLPFIFFAIWIDWVVSFSKMKRLGCAIAITVTTVILALNLEGSFAAFRALARNEAVAAVGNRFLSLQPRFGVTFSKIENMAEYLDARSKSEGKEIRLWGIMTFRVPMQYLLESKNPPTEYEILSRKDMNPDLLYFAMVADKDKWDSVPEKHRDKFDILGETEFGRNFFLFELELKPGQEEILKKEYEYKRKTGPAPRRKERVKWENIF